MNASQHRDRHGELDREETSPTRPADERLDDDEAYHLLQTRRRRLVLRYLRDREGQVVMRDVAEQVAAWENDTTVNALRSEERQRVYIPLYKTHLPKLDSAGVIDYDQSRGLIDPGDRIHQLHGVLDLQNDEGTKVEVADFDIDRAVEADGPTRDSTVYYGSVTLFSTGLLTASWAGLVALPGVVLATVITALYTLVTVGVGFAR